MRKINGSLAERLIYEALFFLVLVTIATFGSELIPMEALIFVMIMAVGLGHHYIKSKLDD